MPRDLGAREAERRAAGVGDVPATGHAVRGEQQATTLQVARIARSGDRVEEVLVDRRAVARRGGRERREVDLAGVGRGARALIALGDADDHAAGRGQRVLELQVVQCERVVREQLELRLDARVAAELVAVPGHDGACRRHAARGEGVEVHVLACRRAGEVGPAGGDPLRVAQQLRDGLAVVGARRGAVEPHEAVRARHDVGRGRAAGRREREAEWQRGADGVVTETERGAVVGFPARGTVRKSLCGCPEREPERGNPAGEPAERERGRIARHGVSLKGQIRAGRGSGASHVRGPLAPWRTPATAGVTRISEVGEHSRVPALV